MGSRDSLLVKAPDSWSKGCEFESWQKRREKFLLQCQLCALTLIRCPFHPSVTAVARKRPRSFCQKCRWEITPKHARIFDQTKSEWADHAAIQAECGNELTRNSSGNTLSQSSQVAKPLWTDPVLKSGTSLRKLISALKKKKKKRRGNELSDILPKSSHARKNHHTTTTFMFEIGYNNTFHESLNCS